MKTDTTGTTELLSSSDISRAAELLLQGEILAFPTETVYGLGALIFLPSAIEKIFIAKGRPSDNPLIAHISNLSQLTKIAKNIPDDFFLLYKAFFPGPLTVVLQKTDEVPSLVSAGLDSIALRMPSHPLALALIEKVGQPLVAPSANISGKPSSTEFNHVLHDFDGKISAIVKGDSSEIGIESTVISLLGDVPTILRPGHITKDQIQSVLKKPVAIASSDKTEGPVLSPGMKYKHYAPDAPVQLFYSKEDLLEYLKVAPIASRMLLSSSPLGEIDSCEFFPLSAKTLYATLRRADAKGFSEVLVYCDKVITDDKALMNRLSRSAEIDP